MKNADLAIRVGVMAALSDLGYTVRDMVARPDDQLPYVLLSSQTAIGEDMKTQFGTQNTLLVQIYGKQSLVVNRGEVDAIADDIMAQLIPIDTSSYIAVSGFQVIKTTLDSLIDDTISDSDGIVCRKQIRIRFILREL